MNDRYKFRAFIELEYNKDNGEEAKIEIKINAVDINRYGDVGFFRTDLIDSLEKTNLSDLEQESAIQYVDDNNQHDEDGYIVIDWADVEQCTGLKDKNGNLIYEGDIIHLNAFCHEITIYHDGIGYAGLVNNERKDLRDIRYELCEIIGNTHENED